MKYLLPLCLFSAFLLADDLDLKIESLKKEIHELRLKAMKNEVESEGTLRYNYGEFVNENERAESYEDQAAAKEKELEKLQMQKTGATPSVPK